MKNIFFVVFILFSAFPLAAYGGEAPEFYFEHIRGAAAPNSEFPVRLLIRSEDALNAFKANIFYSSDILELKGINTASSIIDFWVGDIDTTRPGIIFFEGGSSDAFKGEGGEIITLYFYAKKEGRAQVSVAEGTLYLADGAATPAPFSPVVTFLTISPGGEALFLGTEGDVSPPLFKEVILTENPIENTPMAVFNVVDDGSGVREVSVRFRSWLWWSDWFTAANPVRIEEGAWSVELRAVDNQNNITTETKYIGSEILKKSLYVVVIIMVIVFAAMGIRFFKRKTKNNIINR